VEQPFLTGNPTRLWSELVAGRQMTSFRVVWCFAGALCWTWVLLGAAWVSGASATEPPTSWLRLASGVGPIIAATVLLRLDRQSADRCRSWMRWATIAR